MAGLAAEVCTSLVSVVINSLNMYPYCLCMCPCVSILQLLGELLLDRHNYTVMTRYISNPENLKLMMNMLRDRSRNIQFEAFHVFKVIGRGQEGERQRVGMGG